MMRTTVSRPILMKPDLVEATIWGLKTETRRIPKKGTLMFPEFCQYGQVGDHLWTREPVRLRAVGGDWYDVVYKVKDDPIHQFPGKPHPVLKMNRWTPSIHMPKAVSRLDLKISQVTAPLLQSLTSEQAAAEGWHYFAKLEGHDLPIARSWFRLTWDSINEKRGFGWDENPRVWRIQYTVAHALR